MANLKMMKWFIVPCVALVIVIGSVASCSSDTDKTAKNDSVVTSENTEVVETEPEPVIEPMVVTVDKLVDALNENALKAANTYKDSYVKLTGRLSSIDSDGSYFTLAPSSDDFSFDTVMCKIKKEHLDAVMNFTKEQEVTVIGTITSVGDLMGYTLRVESIE